MKISFAKRVAPALLLAILAIPTSGHAAIATTVREAAIKAVWNEVLAVTEAVWACDGAEPAAILDGGVQGLDAYVIALPDGSAGQRIEMTYLRTLGDTEPVGAIVVTIPDIDWYFFDEECNSLGHAGMATATALEKGKVPTDNPATPAVEKDAKWAIAYLFAGPPSYFTVEIDSVVL